MSKDIELSIACEKLMRAIKKGNKTLTNANNEKKWEAYKTRNLKLKNLRKKA